MVTATPEPSLTSPKNVLGADVIVMEAFGFFLRKGNDFTGAIGEFIKHINPLRRAEKR